MAKSLWGLFCLYCNTRPWPFWPTPTKLRGWSDEVVSFSQGSSQPATHTASRPATYFKNWLGYEKSWMLTHLLKTQPNPNPTPTITPTQTPTQLNPTTPTEPQATKGKPVYGTATCYTYPNLLSESGEIWETDKQTNIQTGKHMRDFLIRLTLREKWMKNIVSSGYWIV